MTKPTLLFLHGWKSVPGGRKPTWLKENGYSVLNPALPDDDFGRSVEIAQRLCQAEQPTAIIGSSRGGAVAMNLGVPAPLVLMCPAWKRWGNAKTTGPRTVILHSRGDDVIPFAESEELVRNSRLPQDALIEVGTDHRLAEPEPLKCLLEVLRRIPGCDTASA